MGIGQVVQTDHIKLKKQKVMAEDKIFADGFMFKRAENAPDFVVGRISLKVEEALPFIKQHAKNGWVNLNIKTARSGNHYVELDTYEPKDGGKSSGKPSATTKAAPNGDDDIPF